MPRYKLAIALAVITTACATKQPAPVVRSTEPLVETPSAPAPSLEPPFRCDEVAADWPMFQRGPGREGATEAPPIESPTIAWSKPIGIASWLDSPIIAGGRVFAPSSGQVWNRPDGADGVYAFGLSNGDPQWFAPTEDDANGVAYHRCRVFVGSDSGTVIALDARSGSELWSRKFAGKIYSNPLPFDDVVVVAGEHGVVYALEIATGKTVWMTDVGAAVRGGAAADSQQVYIATEAARVFALSKRNGAIQWSTEITAPGVKAAYSVPTVRDSKVYVGFVRDTSYSAPAIRVYDAKTGDPGWVATNTQALTGGWGNVRSSPALHDGRLYWGESYSNRIVALDTARGDVTASATAGFCMFPQWPSPAVAQELLYLPRHDGGLYAYNLETSSLRWSLFVGEANHLSQNFPPEHLEQDSERCSWDPPFGRPVYASPAVAADGTLIIATGDGWLHAIRDAALGMVE